MMRRRNEGSKAERALSTAESTRRERRAGAGRARLHFGAQSPSPTLSSLPSLPSFTTIKRCSDQCTKAQVSHQHVPHRSPSKSTSARGKRMRMRKKRPQTIWERCHRPPPRPPRRCLLPRYCHEAKAVPAVERLAAMTTPSHLCRPTTASKKHSKSTCLREESSASTLHRHDPSKRSSSRQQGKLLILVLP